MTWKPPKNPSSGSTDIMKKMIENYDPNKLRNKIARRTGK